jgi:hypothetical protein
MLKVCEKKCDECLFTKNRIVSEARMRALLADCAKRDTHFICHKATINGEEVCCRGFYETRTSNLMRIAQRLNWVQLVPVPDDQVAETA